MLTALAFLAVPAISARAQTPVRRPPETAGAPKGGTSSGKAVVPKTSGRRP